MKRIFQRKILSVTFTVSLLLILMPLCLFSQIQSRTEIGIPDIPGYLTLKCDFHMHTVFSDGTVWPTVRVEEAWREGLDVISITDHIEYLPHRDDMTIDLNRPYEIAYPAAGAADIMIIKGGEITRGQEPPGHHNAIFLDDITPLDMPDFRDAIEAAINQDGFVFWNHPGWKQPGLKAVWYDTAEELLQKGWLHGIEVVNGGDYYPEAHQWCLDKNLTMMGNSDIHAPTTASFEFDKGQHRSMTLVFVKEKTESAIEEALFDRRTAVYWNDTLIGEEQYLKPLFEASVQIKNPDVIMKGRSNRYIQITNTSDIPFVLTRSDTLNLIDIPAQLTLHQNRTVLMRITGKNSSFSGETVVSLPYTVTNLWTAPDRGLPVDINLNITFDNEN